MTETPTEPPEPAPGRPAYPPEAWAAAREDYVSGLSARAISARLGMSESAIHQRARREGWRRIDQPWTPVLDEGAELEARCNGDVERVELTDLSYVAHLRMKRAVLRGAAAEALRWKRVADMLMAEHEELERLGEEMDAARDAMLEQARQTAARRAELGLSPDPDDG